MKFAQWMLGSIVLIFAVGACSTSQFVNLTPSELPRKANGLYPFEVAFHTRQRSMIKDSIEAYVVINRDFFPMRRTELVEGRWETMVPIDARTNKVYYRYRFDYLYKAFPQKKKGSILSPPYQLLIMDERS